MNVLSLFDGISCGQLALHKLGVNYKYFASEISIDAMTVTQHHFPDTIQLGDIRNYHNFNLPKIDLLIGGSPCQGFSFAGKELNFKDERSKLFFEFVECVAFFKPTYFMLENVIMRSAYSDIITKYLGVEPVCINSALVSAQNRNRLYWANFPISQPNDKSILFTDKINGIPGRMVGRRIVDGKRKDLNKSIPYRQYIECRSDNKSNCVTTVLKDIVVTNTFIERELIENCEYRYAAAHELEWLQTIPENYTAVIKKSKRVDAIGNAWTVDVITHILSHLPL